MGERVAVSRLSGSSFFSDFHPGTELTAIDRTLLINWTNSLDEIFSVRAREREKEREGERMIVKRFEVNERIERERERGVNTKLFSIECVYSKKKKQKKIEKKRNI